jgi:hypothetical protein
MPVVLKDFLDVAAVTYPEKIGAPQSFPILTNGPTASRSLADK